MQTYQLTSPVPLVHSSVITIPLSDVGPTSDLVSIREDPTLNQLGLFRNSTFLSFPATAASDAQGLPVIAVPSDNATQVSAEPGNLVPPELISYVLNLDTRSITVEFSEMLEIVSFDFTAVRLISSPGSSIGYTLTGGTAFYINGTRYLLQLTDEDVNRIQADTGLATSDTNVFLTLERGFASDSSGLSVLPIAPADAIPPLNYTRDSRPPELIGFELSLNGTDVLTLTFSETVIISSFDISLVTLLSAPQASAIPFTFDSSTMTDPGASSGSIIRFNILMSDKASYSSSLVLLQLLMTPISE